MPDSSSVIVASGASLASSLGKLLGESAAIIHPPLKLIYGPLVPFDIEEWIKWIDQNIEFDLSADELRQGWISYLYDLQNADHLEFWVNRNFSADYSAYLFGLSMIKADSEVTVIDCTDHDLGRFPLATLPEKQLAVLRQESFTLTEGQRAEDLAIWQALNVPPSQLRLVENKSLKDAPLDYFDAAILAQVSREEFSQSTSIVGKVLGYAKADMADDIYIGSRVFRLIEEGLLESSGDLSNMSQFKVRRV